MQLDRRKFLKIGGAGLAGLAVSGLDLPWLSCKPALATAMSGEAWCFGVMADTQWKTSGTPEEMASTCAVSIIEALNEQFKQHQCKFVIQVGDLVDKEVINGVRTLPVRAAHCQALYDAGIGFFPVRGNHEATAVAAGELPSLFPQTLGQGAHLFGAENFSSPVLSKTLSDPTGTRLQGLTYSFDFQNVRCVLIDQFTRRDNTNYTANTTNNNLVDQMGWVDEVLSANAPDRHAFVFAHKNLIGQNHKDVLFGANLSANAEVRDQFIKTLDTCGVRYSLGGHDHMHHRSVVSDAQQAYNVDQIICSSNSYKFYIPKSGDDGREIPVVQELFSIGFYIITVDGPRVTVDFYSSSHGSDYGDIDLLVAPTNFPFYLRERFGYSLNGQQYLVRRGESYTAIQGQYKNSTARIIGGVNGNTETDYLGRELAKTVNTGWADGDEVTGGASAIFSLWGLADNLSLYDEALGGLLPDQAESRRTDTYTLSMRYDAKKVRPSQLATGTFALAGRDERKVWKNAVHLNEGGVKKFVFGPWKEGYGLGTYGVDAKTSTVWAVLNHEGDFVAKFI